MTINLKYFRLKKGYSVLKAAEKSGVSPEFYRQIENGEVKPSITVAQRIAETLNCNWKSLI